MDDKMLVPPPAQLGIETIPLARSLPKGWGTREQARQEGTSLYQWGFLGEKKPSDLFQASVWRTRSTLLSGAGGSFSISEFLGVVLRSTDKTAVWEEQAGGADQWLQKMIKG